jgi:phosphohistidine phosphatase SixA
MNPEKADFITFRHQEAGYKANRRVLESDDPQGPVRPDDQDFITDLTEKGRFEARNQAEQFFARFDPSRDAFFFVSSDFVRAAETAKIYLDVAEEKKFEIIAPERTGDKTVAAVGEGKIKHLQNLSLKIDDALVDQLFNHKADYLKLAQDRGVALDDDLIARWEKAREIIEDDNKGTWSENWRYHSEQIKKIMPEIMTAREMFEKQFKNMTRLMEFGRKKIESAEHPKKIRVLAFTHENLFTHWLSERWGEPGLNLGESVSFYHDPENNLRADLRGKDGSVEE